jgi:hypothetical protein
LGESEPHSVHRIGTQWWVDCNSGRHLVEDPIERWPTG